MTTDEYQAFFVEHSKNFKMKESDVLAVYALGLAGETGEIIEHIKKYIRDGELDREALIDELGDQQGYFACLCSYFGISMQEAMDASIKKAIRRKNNNSLQGKDREY